MEEVNVGRVWRSSIIIGDKGAKLMVGMSVHPYTHNASKWDCLTYTFVAFYFLFLRIQL